MVVERRYLALRSSLIRLNTRDPFELISLVTRTARDFDLAQIKNNTILQGNAGTHSENLKHLALWCESELNNQNKILYH